MWEIAYAHWPEPAYAQILLEIGPTDPMATRSVRWTTLTSGVPVADF